MAYPKLGSMAPKFTLMNQNGEEVSLKSFQGQANVILYFYPKAMTPGCTVQACGLRDAKKKLTSANTVALGVSPDSVDRLTKFIAKEKLNFDLLSDPDHVVANQYGTFGRKKFMGKEYDGILRTTFIIGTDGRLKHIMDKVKTKTHHDDALAWINEHL